MRKKNILENKGQRKPLACVCRHEPAYTAFKPAYAGRVSETYERQAFCINVEVWNK